MKPSGFVDDGSVFLGGGAYASLLFFGGGEKNLWNSHIATLGINIISDGKGHAKYLEYCKYR